MQAAEVNTIAALESLTIRALDGAYKVMAFCFCFVLMPRGAWTMSATE